MGIEDVDDVLPSSLSNDPWEREVQSLLASMDRDVATVVVEGPNDRNALRTAGVESRIEMCSRCPGLDRFAIDLTGDTVAILTDYDDHVGISTVAYASCSPTGAWHHDGAGTWDSSSPSVATTSSNR